MILGWRRLPGVVQIEAKQGGIISKIVKIHRQLFQIFFFRITGQKPNLNWHQASLGDWNFSNYLRVIPFQKGDKREIVKIQWQLWQFSAILQEHQTNFKLAKSILLWNELWNIYSFLKGEMMITPWIFIGYLFFLNQRNSIKIESLIIDIVYSQMSDN